jgi:hypothetical protein
VVRRLPERLRPPADAFSRALDRVDHARSALAGSVPTPRLAGRPLAETLAVFEDDLGEVRSSAGSWRVPEVEPEWQACVAALDQALSRAEHLRLKSPAIAGFEGLLGAIDDLLAPLDAFDRAEDRFRDLRREARAR